MLVTTVQICGEYSWWSWGSCLPPETAADEWMAFFLARTGSGRQDEWHDEIFYYIHRTVQEEAVKHQTFTRETNSNPITWVHILPRNPTFPSGKNTLRNEFKPESSSKARVIMNKRIHKEKRYPPPLKVEACVEHGLGIVGRNGLVVIY